MALEISRREYDRVSADYREAVDTNADPARTAVFLEARADAARGGRERFSGGIGEIRSRRARRSTLAAAETTAAAGY